MRELDITFADDKNQHTRHRVRLYPLSGWTTAIVTDRSQQNHCASVTNTIEPLVNTLIKRENLDPLRLVIIEHYDDLSKESFDLVRFDRLMDGLLHYPSWKAISREEAMDWAGQGENRHAGRSAESLEEQICQR
jgi:hypothetical protein